MYMGSWARGTVRAIKSHAAPLFACLFERAVRLLCFQLTCISTYIHSTTRAASERPAAREPNQARGASQGA